MFRLSEVKRILINRRHVHIQRGIDEMVVIGVNIAWKSVNLKATAFHFDTRCLLYRHRHRQNSWRCAKLEKEYPLASAVRCRSLSRPVLGSWYHFMNMVDWFWNENVRKAKLQIEFCFLCVHRVRVRLTAAQTGWVIVVLDAYTMDYAMCSWTISMCPLCAIHESVHEDYLRVSVDLLLSK